MLRFWVLSELYPADVIFGGAVDPELLYSPIDSNEKDLTHII